MARYINQEETLKIIYDFKENCEHINYGTLLDIMRAIRKLPTEDVAPIIRGKWEFDEKGYYCNKCGYRPFAGAYQFCAVCGADMRSMKEKTTINFTKTTITDGDLISRNNAIELVNYALAENKDVLEVLENMPSAEK